MQSYLVMFVVRMHSITFYLRRKAINAIIQYLQSVDILFNCLISGNATRKFKERALLMKTSLARFISTAALNDTFLKFYGTSLVVIQSKRSLDPSPHEVCLPSPRSPSPSSQPCLPPHDARSPSARPPETLLPLMLFPWTLSPWAFSVSFLRELLREQRVRGSGLRHE